MQLQSEIKTTNIDKMESPKMDPKYLSKLLEGPKEPSASKTFDSNYHLLLLFFFLCSLFLNVLFFLSSSSFTYEEWPELSWSKRAAAEAEAAAALSCSGHGSAFLDGTFIDGKPACECNTCYGGQDCSVLLPGCSADVASGDPLFLEPYWRQHAAGSAVLVAGWHRMSYNTNGDDYISVELEKLIRKLHSYVGNAITEGRFIVFGAGSTQLLNAAVHALSPNTSSSLPAAVVASVPYYPVYRTQTDFFNSRAYEWKGVASSWVNGSNSTAMNFIEFVTSPNNPDGQLHQPILGGSSVVHDHAYFWPHFSAIGAPADGDLMLFTLSKLTGHAGSRFGWAVVKDESVYKRMVEYLGYNMLGVSRDTQLRTLKLLKTVLAQGEGGGNDIFGFGFSTMEERWQRLNEIVSSSSNRFSLQQLPTQYCNYFRNVRGPSPAYGWLRCEMEEDTDCSAVLTAGGIISRGGANYGADSRYTRLSLIKSQDDFELLLQRMNTLINGKSAKTGR